MFASHYLVFVFGLRLVMTVLSFDEPFRWRYLTIP